MRQDVEQLDRLVDWLDRWRMRRLDALIEEEFKRMPTSEVLTAELEPSY